MRRSGLARFADPVGLAALAGLAVLIAAPSFAGETGGGGREEDLRAAAQSSFRRGVSFLLETQRNDGSWGSGESARTDEVLADVPGSHHAFRVGTTALCVLALHSSHVRREECARAVERGVDFLLEHYRVRRPNGMEMYNVWAFGYGLEAFAAVLDGTESPERRQRILHASDAIVRALEIYQTPDGGWGYYDFNVGSYRPSDASMSFTTATILVAIDRVEKRGVEVPRRLVERAVLSLRRCRLDDGAYLYGPDRIYVPQAGYNKVKGSLGRTHACNLALRLHGGTGAAPWAVSDDDLRRGLENFFRYYRFMDIGRKRPMPHEAWYYTSGYYFYYGHYYARLVIDLLPEPERDRWRARLAEVIVERQEPDGSWWDFPLYHYYKPYGTAYALLALER